MESCENADFICKDDDFSKYRVVILPHVVIADEALKGKVEAFTQNGGIAIISARSGAKDTNALYRTGKAPGVFRKLSGCRVDWFTSMPKYESRYVDFENKRYTVNDYYEMLEAEDGEIQGTYTEGFCKNKGAIVKNGNVYYIGFYCRDNADIYADIIKKHISVAEAICKDVEEYNIGSYRLYLNYSDSPVNLSGYDLIKEADFECIEPYGVVLIENK